MCSAVLTGDSDGVPNQVAVANGLGYGLALQGLQSVLLCRVHAGVGGHQNLLK